MNHTIELLMSAVGDLLYRVRVYDRRMLFADEIAEIDRTFERYSQTPWTIENEKSKRRAIEQLARMKSRLLTMLEDLLYIA
jgi:hypothetical protein